MLKPLDPQAWDVAKAAHLLNRAGFGGTPEEIRALHALGFEKAVACFVDAPDDSARYPQPDWAVPGAFFAMRKGMRGLSEEERKMKQREVQQTARGNTLEMTRGWLERMRTTQNPLREKLTLFWHGHFATSLEKAKDPYLMLAQNETLRRGALANFGSLTKAIARDPAMMLYLDTAKSRKEKPNENFARELMELFTLGIGNYTEEDIAAAARAFTGYKIDPRDQTFQFSPKQHDAGEKRFSGKTGNFDGDGIIDIILTRPACAQFITAKLWTFFAAENPAPALVDALADSFRAAKYEVHPVMREMLRSEAFYALAVIRSQIKSPVQWFVQTAKIFESQLPRDIMLMNALRQLGQVPFQPPSVKGWDGGKSWITTSTLLFRYNVSSFIVGTGPLEMAKKAKGPGRNNKMRAAVDFAKVAPLELRKSPTKLLDELSFRLFQTTPGDREMRSFAGYLAEKDNTDDKTIAGLLHLMMSTPQFQLT